MSKKTLVGAGLLALAALALAMVPGLKLMPGTIGNGATAAWTTERGVGAANHYLVLDKFVPTAEWEAAGADIQRIAGTLVTDIDALSWNNMTPATAGGGSPRWDLYYGPAGSGFEGYTFLEPTVSDTNLDGVIDHDEIMANPYWVGRAPTATDEVKYLQIIVDEQERVELDDISVTVNGVETVFTGPGKSN